jgi:hypothetical protein
MKKLLRKLLDFFLGPKCECCGARDETVAYASTPGGCGELCDDCVTELME